MAKRTEFLEGQLAHLKGHKIHDNPYLEALEFTEGNGVKIAWQYREWRDGWFDQDKWSEKS